MLAGNRNHYGMMKVGGVRYDVLKEHVGPIKKSMDEAEKAVGMFKGAVMDDPVLQARLKGVGVLTRSEAVDWCVVGPTARASGVDIDVRRDDPYAAYDRVQWDVILREEGDVFAKTVVRLLEMEQSIRIVRQCLDQMPEGEIDAGVKDIPPGEGIGRVEAPRGECFHYVRGDGTNRPVRHKVRAPSYMNVASNQVGAVGGTVSDAAITLAAVDPCYCCTERTCVMDKTTEEKIMTGRDLIALSQAKTAEIKERLGKT